jgi:transcriptional regulator with XRE-family HTH domain
MADDLRSLLASQDIRDAVRQRRYGVVLRRARQARGLTQAQAGELAGYSGATISRFETGTRRLADIDTLRRLAGALGAAPEVFGLTPGTAEFPGGARAGAVPGEALLATVVTGLPLDGDDVRRRDMITQGCRLPAVDDLRQVRHVARHPAGQLPQRQAARPRQCQDPFPERGLGGTHARPLCVRGHRNMTVYSATR